MAGRFSVFALAILCWLIIGGQMFNFARGASRAHFPAILGVIAALGFFTTQTNILVAMIVTASALRGHSTHFLTRPGTMAAAVVYIFAVGVIYSLVLRPPHWQSHLQRAVEQGLHDVIPTLYILYWLVFAPKGALTWKQPVRWLTYPSLYLVCALLVAGITDRPIYPFIDIPTLGYPRFLMNLILLLTGFLTVGLIIVWIDGIIGRRRGAEVISTTVVE